MDDPAKLAALVRALAELARQLTIIFPIHPRTRKNALEAGLEAELARLLTTEPLGYLEFLKLIRTA